LTLNKKGFPLLKAAVQDADAAQLARLLAPRFHGEVIDFDQGRSFATDAVSIRRVRPEVDQSVKLVPVSKAQFVDYVLSLRGKFATDPVVEIKLVDFAPLDRDQLNGAWNGTFKFRIASGLEEGARTEIFLEVGFRLLRVADADDIAKDKEWIE